MRILDADAASLELDNIGMLEHERSAPRPRAPQDLRHDPRHRPDGLRQDDHALRRAAARSTTPERSIITVEDPVEYELDGLKQIAGQHRSRA